MLKTIRLAPARKPLCKALFTKQVIFAKTFFSLHCVQTVFYTSKVWHTALRALVKSALVQCKTGQLPKIVVARSDDAPLGCVSFIFCYFYGHLHYLELELKMLKQFLRDNWHTVVYHYLLLATWAVQVAERNP